MIRNGRFAVCTIVVLLLWSTVAAEIPQIISYQGKITESGQAVADGSYTMRFRIYNAPTSGTLRWDSGNQTVQVTGGIFSILLGDAEQPSLSLSFYEDLWLLVTFEGVNQAPRQRLASVGYAYMASGIVPGTEVSGVVTSGLGAAFVVENTVSSISHGIIGKTNGSFGVGVKGISENSGGIGVYGAASASIGTTYGVYGSSNSSIGYGVYGENDATVGATYGVYGTINSSFGAGVYGKSENSGADLSYGVKGSYNADGDGAGIYGEATATSPGASPSGVRGIAWSTSGTSYGGIFESQSTSGTGVYGAASATTGTTYGVYGSSNSSTGYGLYGEVLSTQTGTAYGVYGLSLSGSGIGVYGEADPSSAGNPIGIFGKCEPGDYHGTGVVASGQWRGIYGYCSTDGSYGGEYYGGYMRGNVSGSTGFVFGVYGSADGGAYHCGVYYSGGINGSGVMRNTVRTDDGPVSLYVQQATENWFEDFGSGIVRNGSTRIELREDYRKTITSNEAHPLKVFVTPTAQLGEWWVDKDSHGFTLMAPEAPDGASFDYRIVAKRKDAEELRLESTPSGYIDKALYPDDTSVPAEYLSARRKIERVQESDFE